MTKDEQFDALVIGGGPAGLSAAIYLGRGRRTAVVFDCPRPGRSDWGQFNQNYLGFPDGIPIDDLGERGRRQAEKFGATFVNDEVQVLERDGDGFHVRAPSGTWRGRTVILAMGVQDRWAHFPGFEQFIGKTMHWCIACDGYEMEGQRVVVVGNDAHAAEMAIQMGIFRPESVTVLTNHGSLGISADLVASLERHGIPLVIDRIADVRARQRGDFEALVLERGDDLPLDHLFSVQGARPNTALAVALGVDLNEDGYIRVDTEGRTNLPRVYAAGDVTRLFSHQVVTAAHEGAAAASAAIYDLYRADEDAPEVEGRLPDEEAPEGDG